MDLKQRMNVVQAKMNGTVAALTYGYMAHMNNASVNIIDIDTDKNAVNSDNMKNSACSSEILRGLVHAFQDSYKGTLAVDDTVCDPKYIPWNCVMKDKNGITQRGAAADLFIDYPYTTKGKRQFSDGWTEGSISSTKRDWTSVCYGNGKFVAIAYNSNYFAYSIDGITWTESTISSTSRYWYDVCYGNGKYVIIEFYSTNSNYFAYSTDGINWTETNNRLTVRPWRSVCYGNGKFVTISGGNSSSNYFAYSIDGITWTEGTISSTSRRWNSVCYDNGKYVAVANGSNYFAYSTDGINWTEGTISSTSRYWESVCYGNGKFVAVAHGTNVFAYSSDGINWTETNSGLSSKYWRSGCYGNGKFVAVGEINYYAYSTDGMNWTEDTISNTEKSWCSVCYGKDKFVAVTQGNNMYFAYIYTDHYNYNIIPSDSIQELSNTDITYDIGVKENRSDIDAGFITFNHTNNSIYGVIPFSDIVAPQILKDAIQANNAKFITKKYKDGYRNDQFYRYLTFTDNGTSYIGITNDMMHFTVYNITGSYAFRDGVILMHISEKDAIAMITRHPITTDIITIDGNDPENMTDYSKPYYRLIELPFLKKYYKYSGKHVQNVKLGINSSYTDLTEWDNPITDPLSNDTLIISAFNKIYRIGIPNFDDVITPRETKYRLQNFYINNTYDDLGINSAIGAVQMYRASSAIARADGDDTKLSAQTFYKHGNVDNTSSILFNINTLQKGYDYNMINTTIVSYNKSSAYTYCGKPLNSQIPEPDTVIYPVTTYNPNA